MKSFSAFLATSITKKLDHYSGELAADLELTETFLAIGIDELSVTPRAVLPLRGKVREVNTYTSSPHILNAIADSYTRP